MVVTMSRIKQPGAELSIKQAAFLAAYAQTGIITKAAEIAGIHRNNHRLWLKEDAEYAEAFKESHQEACDNIEAEMRRRAIEGVQKPVFYKGEVCGYITEYSDTMLAMLANGFMPEKYKQNARIEVEVVSRDEARRKSAWPQKHCFVRIHILDGRIIQLDVAVSGVFFRL